MKPRPCPTCHSTRICASVQIPTIWQCLNRSCEAAFFDAQGVMATADALSRLRQTPPPTAEETHTHDYTRRRFGHDYAVTRVQNEGQTITVMGWGRGIKPDDYLILAGDDPDRSTRYQVSSIKYQSDPPDMWTATAEFAPRPRVYTQHLIPVS